MQSERFSYSERSDFRHIHVAASNLMALRKVHTSELFCAKSRGESGGFPGPKGGTWGTRLFRSFSSFLLCAGDELFCAKSRGESGGFPGPKGGTWGTRLFRSFSSFLLCAGDELFCAKSRGKCGGFPGPKGGTWGTRLLRSFSSFLLCAGDELFCAKSRGERSWFPTLPPEKRRKDGAPSICGAAGADKARVGATSPRLFPLPARQPGLW